LDLQVHTDIYSLTEASLKANLFNWAASGIEDVDLVCGGPPCQGFSGIGHRRTFTEVEKQDIPTNHLYQEMARVIRTVQPRAFLFENVKGLLSARWERGKGAKGEIFKAVLEEFSSIPNYEVRWELIHAKDYGVPQNRPRVLIVGIREDVIDGWRSPLLFDAPFEGPSAIKSGLLPGPVTTPPPSIPEVLSDLANETFGYGSEDPTYKSSYTNEVQRQLRTRRSGSRLKKGDPLCEQYYSNHSQGIREKFAHMIKHDGEIPEKFQTKKFAQRVLPRSWGPTGPNITVASLAEDYVHYSLPRSLTVREWARLQGFPDWYIFKGPRTTGGRRRAGDPSKGVWDREVPKYTQIGNAVPVQLAHAIGKHLASLLGA